MVFPVLVSPAKQVLAQSPCGRPADPRALHNQDPYMHDMQAFQARYDAIKKENSLERKAITEQIHAEE